MDTQAQSPTVTSASSIAQLGQAIKDNAERIEAYLTQNNVPNPTFDMGTAVRFGLPAELEDSRQHLFDDVEHLTALLRGPLGHVLTHSNPVSFSYNIVLSAISRFRIAEHLPLGGSPISISALAKACHMHSFDLTPIIRTAIANRTFTAVGTDSVAHNAVSYAIATMPDLQHWLDYCREDFIPAAFALPEAISENPGGSSPGRAAFALTHEGMAMFDSIKADPKRADRFAGSMRLLGSASAAEIPRVVEALQLDDVPEGAVIVDIGGSTGEVLTQILRRYKHLRGICQDLSTVISNAQIPADLVGRLTFQTSDFFVSQPHHGAALYFLRKILHDWSDEYAQKILQVLVPALEPGSKVILNEICLPPHGSVHPRREQNQQGWNLAMKWLLNGKERDEREWKDLFEETDGRFEFVGVKKVEGAGSSLVEFVWE